MDEIVAHPPYTSAGHTTPAAIAHGGRLADARRRYPHAPAPFLDLSTGINPIPYPLPPLAPDAFNRLPEPDDEAALRAAAARAYGVADEAMVAAAPGTQILINLIPKLFPRRTVRVLAPTYAEHALCWRASGPDTRGGDVREVGDFAALAEADAAVVCNPNNPDGRRIEPDALHALADRLAARGGLLIVDEAFADLEDGISAAASLPHPAMLILRSFGKVYGLAGVRLGFALAAPSRAAMIRDALGPWAVSGPAIAIARAAFADTAWLAATRARLDDDVAALDDLLARAGLRVLGGTRLFRLAASDDAAAMYERLARAGILVRPFANNPSWLRFGMPGDERTWKRLAAALG